MSQTLVFATLALTLGMFIWGSVRYDFVALGALFVLSISGIIAPEEAFHGFGHTAVITVAAVMIISKGMLNSGVIDSIARQLKKLGGKVSLQILALLMVITMLLSDIVNNAATAILMAPIALRIAEGASLAPDAFLMTIAIGASSAFLTPVGHQSNTLVMGPGGYKFSDYWRLGLPLEIIIVCVSVPLIMLVWL